MCWTSLMLLRGRAAQGWGLVSFIHAVDGDEGYDDDPGAEDDDGDHGEGRVEGHWSSIWV